MPGRKGSNFAAGSRGCFSPRSPFANYAGGHIQVSGKDRLTHSRFRTNAADGSRRKVQHRSQTGPIEFPQCFAAENADFVQVPHALMHCGESLALIRFCHIFLLPMTWCNNLKE